MFYKVQPPTHSVASAAIGKGMGTAQAWGGPSCHHGCNRRLKMWGIWTLQWENPDTEIEPPQERSHVISKHQCHGAVMSAKPIGDHVMTPYGPDSGHGPLWFTVCPTVFLSLLWFIPSLIFYPHCSFKIGMYHCISELHSFPLDFYKLRVFLEPEKRLWTFKYWWSWLFWFDF